jgi:hypothetical protein
MRGWSLNARDTVEGEMFNSDAISDMVTPDMNERTFEKVQSIA